MNTFHGIFAFFQPKAGKRSIDTRYDKMLSTKELILLFFSIMLMSLPIYFIIPMDHSASLAKWGDLGAGMVQYLISLWSCWLFTVALAVYYKWTEKKNLFFVLNYIYLMASLGVFAHYSHQWFKNQDHPGQFHGDGTMALIHTLKNFLPLLGITVYLQLSVWWFGKKWHRR